MSTTTKKVCPLVFGAVVGGWGETADLARAKRAAACLREECGCWDEAPTGSINYTEQCGLKKRLG